MITDVQCLILTVAAVLGALGAAGLGWLDSGEPFIARKFTSSILRALFAGLLIAAGSFLAATEIDLSNPVMFIYQVVLAVLAGAGIDVGGNRLSGAIAARSKQTSTPT